MDFVTLGMFIIDEIHFMPPKPPELNVLGGAGSWSVFGARIWRPSPHSRRVGWTVHKGSDFPRVLEEEIRSWDTSCNFIDTPDRLTTRGWNKYGKDEKRDFKYLAEKFRVDETQLNETQLLARCFHLICTPKRCVDLVTGILARRNAVKETSVAERDPPQDEEDPVFVWEPVPDSCRPSELHGVMEALKYVDIISPNHQELAALFGESTGARTAKKDDNEIIQEQCSELLIKGFPNGRGAVVVRCGERGCYVATKERGISIPAYYQPQEAAGHVAVGQARKVVDPTGAGNAFLGGFCIGMLEEPERLDRLEQGAVCGTISASFALEQVGLPKLDIVEGVEYWNGEAAADRIRRFTASDWHQRSSRGPAMNSAGS